MSQEKPGRISPFSSAVQDLENVRKRPTTPQTESPAYRLAFDDPDFLTREETRPIRLQLELMKPELLLQKRGIRSTVVVFGGARIPEPGHKGPEQRVSKKKAEIGKVLQQHSKYYEQAREFARLVSQVSQKHYFREFVIVSGGGPGIMEAANRGASDVAAPSIGLNIVLPFEQKPNDYVTPDLCFQFHYFAMRKMHFLLRAKALAFFPGGFGTLDELFEALTLMQTGKIKRMPVVLFGRKFWDSFINFEALADQGTISHSDLELFEFAETAEEGWKIIEEFYPDAKIGRARNGQ